MVVWKGALYFIWVSSWALMHTGFTLGGASKNPQDVHPSVRWQCPGLGGNGGYASASGTAFTPSGGGGGGGALGTSKSTYLGGCAVMVMMVGWLPVLLHIGPPSSVYAVLRG